MWWCAYVIIYICMYEYISTFTAEMRKIWKINTWVMDIVWINSSCREGIAMNKDEIESALYSTKTPQIKYTYDFICVKFVCSCVSVWVIWALLQKIVLTWKSLIRLYNSRRITIIKYYRQQAWWPRCCSWTLSMIWKDLR